jgi:chromosome segregation ATPase
MKPLLGVHNLESQLKSKEKQIEDLQTQITVRETELRTASQQQRDLEAEKREYANLLEQERMVAQDTAASLLSNQEKLALAEEELQEKQNKLVVLQKEKEESVASLTTENAAQIAMINKLHNELKDYDEENKALGERVDVLEESDIVKDRRIKELENEVEMHIQKAADTTEKDLEIAELKRQLDHFMQKEEETRRNELEERALLRKQFESTKEEFQVGSHASSFFVKRDLYAMYVNAVLPSFIVQTGEHDAKGKGP